MRLSATKSLLERDDAIIVASVSCIYGIGDPVDYHGMILHVREHEKPRSAISFSAWQICSISATNLNLRAAPFVYGGRAGRLPSRKLGNCSAHFPVR